MEKERGNGGPGGIGTIVHPRINSTKYNVIVRWDNGNRGAYRMYMGCRTSSDFRGPCPKYDLTLAKCFNN